MPELVESIERLNYQLERNYGKFSELPVWRIVWSEDAREQRKGTFTYTDNSGNFLKEEEGIREVKKYPYIKERYVLERVLPVPEMNRDQLVTPLSYEPVFIFENKNREYLPPRWEVCHLVIEGIMKVTAQRMGYTYKEPSSEEQLYEKSERIKRIHEELFGNDTDTTDLLGAKEGIVVPHPMKES
jgi:hypothetical protein